MIAVFSRKKPEMFEEYTFRSGRPEPFYEKSVLKNFANFAKHLYRSLLSNKGAGWKPPTLPIRDLVTGAAM